MTSAPARFARPSTRLTPPALPRCRARSASIDPCASRDRKSTRLNSSHSQISYAVFCLKKKKKDTDDARLPPCLRTLVLTAVPRHRASDPLVRLRLHSLRLRGTLRGTRVATAVFIATLS